MKDELIEYELVLEIQNSGDLIFLKSILDAEGITYYVQTSKETPKGNYSGRTTILFKRLI